MSKRGKKQNKARRAAHRPQVAELNDHDRMLKMLRIQQREGRKRGETEPLLAWVDELTAMATRASRASDLMPGFNLVVSEDETLRQALEETRPKVRVGDYGMFEAAQVLTAIDVWRSEVPQDH